MITDPLLTTKHFDREAETLRFVHQHQALLKDRFENGETLLHMAAERGYPLLTYYIMKNRYDAEFWKDFSNTNFRQANTYALAKNRIPVLIVMLYFYDQNDNTKDLAGDIRLLISHSLTESSRQRFHDEEKDAKQYIASIEPKIMEILNAKPLTMLFFESACRLAARLTRSTTRTEDEERLLTKKNR
ncbi:MAG: hypothetical protein K0U29_00765 [Gammaproteobacteria bacterium]|nr:hypothetical protein [Gammaproteobacteria bacterium]MCH9743438.1 hypothetical protein [Gammaproteobacteria bacterium]